MTKRQDRDAIYVKRQFDTEIIVRCVRWYVTYQLSYRWAFRKRALPGRSWPAEISALVLSRAIRHGRWQS
jgi:hypothetical protein